MAEIKSFPNNQDVYVGAEWVMKWLHGRTSGVFGAKENLATTVVANSMSIEVSDGIGWLSNESGDGIVFWNDSEKTSGSKLRLTHDVADSALNRIDRVVVSWQTTNYVALPEVEILKGTPASNPVAPALTNNSTMRQISLAAIKIPAGTTAITAAMITDERLNKSVCGIVTESVVVDTSMAESQFNELLERIENNLQQIVSGEIPDKAVTRAKLANDALYSPLSQTSSKNITTSDIGRTIYNLWNQTSTWTVTQQNSSIIPTGSEVAFTRWGSADIDVVVNFDGTRFALAGAAGYSTGKLKISETFGMIAIKKFSADSTKGDVWLVTGNVEVIE